MNSGKYNDTKHRKIKIKPKDVTKQNEKKFPLNVYKKNVNVKRLVKKSKFKVGDKAHFRKRLYSKLDN